MSLRTSAQEVDVFTLGGQNFLGSTKSWNFDITVVDDDCRVAVDRYHTSVPVKKRLEFSIERIPHVLDVCQSNLNLSVYTVDGDSFLGELESGSITINTDVQDGSAIADLWEFPNAVGTGLEIQTSQFVTNNATLFQLAGELNVSSVQVEVALTLGPVTVVLPMTLTAASVRIQDGQLQMTNCTFKLRGEPDTVSGDAMVIEILTGDAFLSWAIDTGAGSYSGNAIITQTTINFNQAQLQSMQHTLANQGAPTLAAA